MDTSKVSKPCEEEQQEASHSKKNTTSDNSVIKRWKSLLSKLRFKKNIMSDNFFTEDQHTSKVSSRPGSVCIEKNDTSDDCFITERHRLFLPKMIFKNQENTNSIVTDQEILEVLSRSCSVYDEGDATRDNPVKIEQCTSDVLSKPKETIQEVPWNQENNTRVPASTSQFYHLINVPPKCPSNQENFTRYEPVLRKYQWNEETATPDKSFLLESVSTCSRIKGNIISNETFIQDWVS